MIFCCQVGYAAESSAFFIVRLMGLQNICHDLRNGLLVIRGICLQMERGHMSQESGLDKIRRRCIKMEAALERETHETAIHHHPPQPD